jgi:alkylation response protein AidB-like acyl-CoA dehydrogenase
MNFGFSDEQNLLRDQVERFMHEACPISSVRELAIAFPRSGPSSGKSSLDDSQTQLWHRLWEQMADLGWLGLVIPEQYGGLGLKWVDLTVVLEATAAGLSPMPIASQALASTALLLCANETQKSTWLPEIASGKAICTLGLYDDPNWIDPAAISATATPSANAETFKLAGVKPFVNDAANAQYLLLAVRVGDGLALAALQRDQLNITTQPTIDATKPMSSVDLNGVEIEANDLLPMTADQLAYLTDCGAMATTAEMVGAAAATLQLTSDYAKERIQFGKPIGQYQGVKHRLADMFVDIESFRSLCYYAAWTVDDAKHELPRAISLAKGYASDAFAQIGIDGIGLHGAIGFTAEYDAQLYFKRSKWARPMYGDSEFHLDRVATLGGL